MEKTPLEIAQQAFVDWLQLVDDILADAVISFEEFTGHGLRQDLHEAGRSLARAEYSIRSARVILAAGIEQGRPESSPESELEPGADHPPTVRNDEDLPTDEAPHP